MVSSTGKIIDAVKAAPSGTKWAIGTELHLVNRLKQDYPEQEIHFLSSVVCMCATMYRIDLAHLCWSLEKVLTIAFLLLNGLTTLLIKLALALSTISSSHGSVRIRFISSTIRRLPNAPVACLVWKKARNVPGYSTGRSKVLPAL